VTTVVGAARNMHDIPDQSRALVSCSRQTWNLAMAVCDGLLQEDGSFVTVAATDGELCAWDI
jgi:hypothetical protein